jgi:hypothetical protein
MPIKSTLYVKITSGVIGASSVKTQELTGRRFTSSPLVPVGQIVTVLPGGATDYFGAGTDEARFASQYFSYISPAPASQANNLQFTAYSPTARTPTIFGSKRSTSLARFNTVTNGALSIQLGDSVASLTSIDLSSAASFADVASTIQEALRLESGDQYTGSIVSFDTVKNEFTVTGSVAQPGAAKFIPVVGVTDVGALMGLGGVGAVESPGSAAQTPLEAFVAAEKVTDSFGSATFADELTLEQALDLAAYVAEQNIKYQIYFSVNRSNYEAYSAALISTPSAGLILNETIGEWKESLPMAIMAATDYQRRNATINYMFRQSSLSYDVTDTAEAIALNDARVNYYGNTAVAGQTILFFQRGFLMGGVTAPVDMNVHANEQWLKASAAAALLSMQLALNKIPANDDGRGYILVQLADLINQAKFNGTISVGKTLTTLQKVAITQLTGDSDAWQAVQTNGVWYDVDIVPVVQTSGVTEYVAKYTIAYSKNDVVRTIEGSHNLV